MTIYKKVLFSVCSAFILGGVLSSYLYAQEKSFVGETISYKIKQLGLRAGSATLVFKGPAKIEGQEAILILFTAHGFNFLDEEEIFVDPKTYYPILVRRNLNIFGDKEKIDEFYDQKKGLVRIVNYDKDRTRERVIEKGKPLDNIYGFIYRHRKEGVLNLNEELSMQLPTQDVTIRFEKKQKMSVAGKVYDAIFMQGKPRNIRIWFDAGENKIPLRIDGAVGFGSAAMIMTKYEEK
ncbi:MAG: DUF3108 domain-containing protein [Candidatus Omnitrophica bacterium]|nr:DUF3108 domain-containing protein [Candidatus Omnitrophota bacterium]